MTFSLVELQDFLATVLLPLMAIVGAVVLAWIILMLLIVFIVDAVG
jgi:hypothetical protein